MTTATNMNVMNRATFARTIRRLVAATGIAMCVAVAFTPAPASAAEVPLKDLEQKLSIPSGAATPNNKLKLRFWERTGTGAMNDPFKSTPRDVAVDNIAVFNPAVETITQASKRKAEAIAAKVDAVMGVGRASVAPYTITDRFNNQYTLYQLNVTNCHKIGSLWDPTFETGGRGDGTRYKNGQVPSPGSYPYRGSMGGSSSGGSPLTSFSAVGTDLFGETSIVAMGIEELYIATVEPSPGASLDSVLQQLASQLDANSVPATYDSVSGVLSLDNEYDDNHTFFWQNTDPGLMFEAEFGFTAVPEPSMLGLASLAVLPLLRRSRTR